VAPHGSSLWSWRQPRAQTGIQGMDFSIRKINVVDGAMPVLAFSKYLKGLGMIFFCLDGREPPMTRRRLGPEARRRCSGICDRRFGGVAVTRREFRPCSPQQGGETAHADLSMPMASAGGALLRTRSSRCLARFPRADSDVRTLPGRRWQVETLPRDRAGNCSHDGSVRVDMGEPFLAAQQTCPTTLRGRAGRLAPGRTRKRVEKTLAVAAVGNGQSPSRHPWPPLNTFDLGAHLVCSGGGARPFPARANVPSVAVRGEPDHMVMRCVGAGRRAPPGLRHGACAVLVEPASPGLKRARRGESAGWNAVDRWDH